MTEYVNTKYISNRQMASRPLTSRYKKVKPLQSDIVGETIRKIK